MDFNFLNNNQNNPDSAPEKPSQEFGIDSMPSPETAQESSFEPLDIPDSVPVPEVESTNSFSDDSSQNSDDDSFFSFLSDDNDATASAKSSDNVTPCEPVQFTFSSDEPSVDIPADEFAETPDEIRFNTQTDEELDDLAPVSFAPSDLSATEPDFLSEPVNTESAFSENPFAGMETSETDLDDSDLVEFVPVDQTEVVNADTAMQNCSEVPESPFSLDGQEELNDSTSADMEVQATPEPFDMFEDEPVIAETVDEELEGFPIDIPVQNQSDEPFDFLNSPSSPVSDSASSDFPAEVPVEEVVADDVSEFSPDKNNGVNFDEVAFDQSTGSSDEEFEFQIPSASASVTTPVIEPVSHSSAVAVIDKRVRVPDGDAEYTLSQLIDVETGAPLDLASLIPVSAAGFGGSGSGVGASPFTGAPDFTTSSTSSVPARVSRPMASKKKKSGVWEFFKILIGAIVGIILALYLAVWIGNMMGRESNLSVPLPGLKQTYKYIPENFPSYLMWMFPGVDSADESDPENPVPVDQAADPTKADPTQEEENADKGTGDEDGLDETMNDMGVDDPFGNAVDTEEEVDTPVFNNTNEEMTIEPSVPAGETEEPVAEPAVDETVVPAEETEESVAEPAVDETVAPAEETEESAAESAVDETIAPVAETVEPVTEPAVDAVDDLDSGVENTTPIISDEPAEPGLSNAPVFTSDVVDAKSKALADALAKSENKMNDDVYKAVCELAEAATFVDPKSGDTQLKDRMKVAQTAIKAFDKDADAIAFFGTQFAERAKDTSDDTGVLAFGTITEKTSRDGYNVTVVKIEGSEETVIEIVGLRNIKPEAGSRILFTGKMIPNCTQIANFASREIVVWGGIVTSMPKTEPNTETKAE